MNNNDNNKYINIIVFIYRYMGYIYNASNPATIPEIIITRALFPDPVIYKHSRRYTAHNVYYSGFLVNRLQHTKTA